MSISKVPQQSPLTFQQAVYKVDYAITKGRYEDVISMLMERSSALSNVLSTAMGEHFRELRMAYCLVKLEQYDKAKNYLQSMLKSDPNETHATALLAYINLIEEEKEEAIFLYSALLGKKKFRKRATKILNEIKSSQNLIKLAMNKPFSFFYPEHRVMWNERVAHNFAGKTNALKNVFLKNKGIATILSIAIFFSVAIFIFSPYGKVLFNKAVNFLFPTSSLSPQGLSEQQQKLWDSMAMKPVENATGKDGVVSFTKLFTNLKNAIATKKVNEAIIIYNEAMAYNAPIPIKEQFEILFSFIPKPNFSQLENIADLSVLSSSPITYKNTYWKFVGRASSVVEKNGVVRMKLLVFEASNLKHVLPVQFDEINLVPQAGKTYEVLMQFVGISEGKTILMNGVGIRPLEQE